MIGSAMGASKQGFGGHNFGNGQTRLAAEAADQLQYMRVGDVSAIPSQQYVNAEVGANGNVVCVQKSLRGQGVDANQVLRRVHDSVVNRQDRNAPDQGQSVCRGGSITPRNFVQNDLRDVEFVLSAAFVPPTMG